MSGAIVIAAGGTGGHLFPAQALAAELVRRGRRVALLTDPRAAAYESGADAIERHVVRSATPSGRSAFGKLAAGASIATGALQARRLLRRLGTRVVVGFGGYPSLPTLLAAPGMGASVVLHEQNAVLGRVNRMMLGKAKLLALSFEETDLGRAAPGLRIVATGNPVRAEVLAQRAHDYAPPQGGEPFRLLVFGGSQGARLFAAVVPTAIRRLPEALRRRLQVIQQARPEDGDAVVRDYRALDVSAEVRSFFDEMPRLMGAAHLVISRAGAGTVAELAAVGRPALLVPYARAMDDHQSANARALANGGGAAVLAEARFTAEELAARLESLLQRPDVLARMAERARALGRPEAAAALADLVEALANGGHSDGSLQTRRAAA